MEDNTQAEASTIEAIDEAALQAFLEGAAPSIMKAEMTPHVFANDRSNKIPFGILDMVYQGVFTNTLGIMICKHKDSGQLIPVLVGLAGEGVYPVAMCIGAEHAAQFMPPDGEGGYLSVEPASEQEPTAS
jgi:hypothetical protein